MTACSSGSAAVKYFSLDITSSYAAPDGFARAVYLVNGQSPGPLLNATQGETFAVNVVNRLPMEIGMHGTACTRKALQNTMECLASINTPYPPASI